MTIKSCNDVYEEIRLGTLSDEQFVDWVNEYYGDLVDLKNYRHEKSKKFSVELELQCKRLKSREVELAELITQLRQ